MKIYTRAGDKGKTSLIGGKRVYKDNLRVETYGSVDELNSILGVSIAHLTNKNSKITKELKQIQNDLFEIGAYLANPSASDLTHLDIRVKNFEKLIDTQTKELPPLRNFILPGGSKAGAYLHQARTVCRRSERQLVALNKKEQIDELLISYVNRLSDLLFTCARYVNYKSQKKETTWLSQINNKYR